jgi:Ca2+-binding RTX toxin-like protein
MAVFTGTSGNNSISGTGGIDTLFGLGGLDTLFGLAGNDTLDGGGAVDTLFGGGGNDRLIGGSANDSLLGGAGDDVLEGGTGADSLVGGIGNDVFVIDGSGGIDDPTDDTVVENAGEGTDTIRSPISVDISTGGLDLPDVENVVLLNSADTDATGNDAANAITGNEGANTIAGGAGDDVLSGGSGPDQISGGDDDDKLFGGAGADSLFGDSGNDSLVGGGGNDELTGGDGNDTYFVDAPGDVVTENAAEGTDTVRTSVSLFAPANVESIVLTGTKNLTAVVTGDVDITGNAGDNIIVVSGAVTGTVSAGAGNDLIDGVGATDTLGPVIGGPGDDTFLYGAVVTAPTEAANEGTDTVEFTTAVTFTLPDNVENAIGSGGNDSLTGNAAANTMSGGGGTDSLLGGGGADVLSGGAALDLLIGGGSRDVLTGGGGADQFRYNATGHGTNVATNGVRPAAAGDVVTDFVANRDVFLFDDTAFDATANGTDDLPFGALTEGVHFSIIAGLYDGTNPGTNANHAAGVETFVFSLEDHTLYFDANGATAGYTVIAQVQDGALVRVEDIAMA